MTLRLLVSGACIGGACGLLAENLPRSIGAAVLIAVALNIRIGPDA